MHIELRNAPLRPSLRLVATALLLTLAACSHFSDTRKPTPDKNEPRAQLSIGYSLLYQEADGIPKLKWILMFKDKPEEMGRLTHDLVSYYEQLGDTMRKLSKQYPAMRIAVAALRPARWEERRQIRAGGATHVLQLTQRATSSHRSNGGDRDRPYLKEVLGDDKGAVGSALREGRGAIEQPLFHCVSCAGWQRAGQGCRLFEDHLTQLGRSAVAEREMVHCAAPFLSP